MKLYLPTAIVLSLAALASQAAFAFTPEAPAVQTVKQLRDAVTAKQKQIAEENRVEAPAPAVQATPLDLPIDTTDSPGATK